MPELLQHGFEAHVGVVAGEDGVVQQDGGLEREQDIAVVDVLPFVDRNVDDRGGDAGLDMGLRTGQLGIILDRMDVEDEQRAAGLDVLAFLRRDLFDGGFADPDVDGLADTVLTLHDLIDGVVDKLLDLAHLGLHLRLLEPFEGRRGDKIVVRRMDDADRQGERGDYQ